MKHSAKKLSVLIFALVCVMCLAVTLVACDGNKNKPVALSAPVIEIDEEGVISWAEVEHASEYKVQEDGKDVETVQTLSYQITQTTPGTYSYTVTAVGDGEKYLDSKPSEAKSYTVAAIKLAKPTLSLQGNVLSWEAVENATAYDVYERGGIVVSDTTQTQYTIPSKEAGSYSYTVVAKGDGEKYLNSDPSDAAQFTVGKLATPSGFSLDANYKPAPRITWTEVEGAAGYSVTLTYNGNAGEAQAVESASFGIEAEAYGNYAISVVAFAKTDDPLHKNSDAGTANFTYANPVAPALTAPEVGKESDGYTLIWDAVDNATSYNVFMGDELVASVPKDALKNIAEAGKPEIWKVYYEAVPKDFDSVGQSVSYKVVAVGDGINFKDSKKSSAVEVFRFGKPSLSVSTDGILSWDPVSGIDSYGSANSFEIYCDGELLTTVNSEDYAIDLGEIEPGYYQYYIIAKDSAGKHMPSVASNTVIFNYMDMLSTDTSVKFAIKQYQEIFIDLDYDVELKKWYDFEIKIVGSSLEDISTLSKFSLDIWGNSTVDDTLEMWDPFYENGVSAEDNVFKASVIPLEQSIKVQISFMQADLNADYVVLEVSMKENTKSDPVKTFPGEQPAEGELFVDGVLGLDSKVTIHYLKWFEHAAIPLDIEGSTGNPLVEGKTYQMQIFAFYDPALDYGYQISGSTQMGYAFDESAFQEGTYKKMSVQYGFMLICDFTLEESVDKIYILNLNEGTYAHLTIQIIESEGGDVGGGEEDDTPVLGVGDDGAVSINLLQEESMYINLAAGVSGDYTITLSSNDFDDKYEIEIHIGFAVENPSYDATYNCYSAEITIPEDITEISIICMNGSAYFTLVTLTGEGGEEGNTILGVGDAASVVVDIPQENEVRVYLDSSLNGEYVISLSGADLAKMGLEYVALYIGEEDDEIELNFTNNYSSTITIPKDTLNIILVGIGSNANSIKVSLSASAGGGSEGQYSNELSLDSSVKLDTVSTTEVKLAEGLASRSYTLTLSSDDEYSLKDQMWGASITVIVGETQYTFNAGQDGNYTGTIEIPEGTTHITIKTAPSTVANVIVTLSVAM